MRHVVDRGVEAVLFEPMLPRQLADDQEQHGGDHQHGEAGPCDQESSLLAPIGQRRRYRGGCDDRYRKIIQLAGRGQPVEAVDGTGQPHRAMVGVCQDPDMNRTAAELRADHRINVRIARQQCSIGMVERNRRAFRQCHGSEESFEAGGRDGPGDDADKLAVQPGDAARNDGCPATRKTAPHQLDQDRRCRRSRLEGLEEIAIGNIDVRERPVFRRVDQFSVGIEYIDAGNVGMTGHFRPQHRMHFRRRHQAAERIGRR